MSSSLTRTTLLLAGVVASSSAARYYVATWGNDTNPGTIELPWRRISKAASLLVPGESVLIRSGIYYESVNPANSGTPEFPITYAGYDTEQVVIDGSEAVTGWVQDSGSRYRAQVSFTPSPRFTTTRDPNGNYGGLVTQDGAKLQYAMELSPAAVDSPGEYYMNDSLSPPYTLYVCARDLGRGFDPNSYEMRVARLRKGFDLDAGRDWLVLERLTIRGVNDNAVHSIGATDCIFRDVTLHTNFITGIYLTGRSDRCLVEGCSFWDNGHGGIELANTRHAVVRQCRFLRRDLGDGCGGNGAHFWLGPLSQFADSNLIENNIAFRTGRYGYQGPFAAISGSYNIVRHNSMVNGAGGAIALIDGGHSTIVNNACDMSASTAHGIAVFPNAARDSWHLINGNCFYADDPTGKFWYDGAIFNNLADWESAAVQTGNIDSLPGFHDPDSEDLHLLPTSACIDRGTRDSAAYEDYDGVAHPQGAGYDIGAFEFLPTGIQEQNVVRPASSATIVRDILALTPAIWSLQSEASLFDASGRRVTSLRPGPNDVSHLAPGVYFAWHGARVTKVIVNR